MRGTPILIEITKLVQGNRTSPRSPKPARTHVPFALGIHRVSGAAAEQSFMIDILELVPLRTTPNPKS